MRVVPAVTSSWRRRPLKPRPSYRRTGAAPSSVGPPDDQSVPPAGPGRRGLRGHDRGSLRPQPSRNSLACSRRRRSRRDVIGALHRAQYGGRNPLAHLTCQPNGGSGVRAAPVTHIARYTATLRPAISQAGTPEQAPCCGHRCPATGNRADRCGDTRPCAGGRCPDDTAKDRRSVAAMGGSRQRRDRTVRQVGDHASSVSRILW
jgi:hypothetical protein